jgi:DNA topoisomerase-2
MGGTHVNYVVNQITEKLRAFIKKKHKIEVKPSDIKSHLHVFISCNINRPKFSSQTKENMVSVVTDYGSTWTCSDKFIQKIITLDVVQSILDWAAAKELAMNNAELRKLNKNLDKADPKNVPKFHDATSKDRDSTCLLLSEGDSALNGILAGRNSKLHAGFPLRGKPINVFEMDIKEVVENKEFKSIMTITGLQLGVQVTPMTSIRFGKIVLATDQDLDGYNIRGLLMNMFYKYWPELFDLGYIYILNTPLVKVKYKSKNINFYDSEVFEQWKLEHSNEKYESKYYKGLGTSSDKEWKEYLSEENLVDNLVQVTIDSLDDSKMFKLIFGKEKGATDRRKDWLGLQENNV